MIEIIGLEYLMILREIIISLSQSKTFKKKIKMTGQEFKEKFEAIGVEADEKKASLRKQYAMSQIKFKIGDIIKNHAGIIKVEKFGTYVGFGLPEPVYIGPELKKDLTPRKDGNILSIYGNRQTELLKSKTDDNN